MNCLLRAFVLSVLVGLVYSHGYFSSLIINGQVLSEGDCVKPHPSNKYDYPISDKTNTAGLQSINMTCGWAGKSLKANRKCPIAAGSTVGLQFHYEMGLGSSDTYYIAPDHKGPCLVYLAKTDDVLPSGPVWFKIFEDGYDTSSKSFCVTRMRANGGKFFFTIPSDLAPGNYVMRSELIALHEGFQLGGAQPYVHCEEITITGSGTAQPSGSYLAQFPGYYKATDAGIYFNIYDNFKTYPIPGPKLYVAGGASGAPSPAPSTTGKVTPSTTGKPVPSTTGRQHSTTGKPAASTTGKAASSTSTGNVTPSTTGKPAPSTTGKPAPSTTGKPQIASSTSGTAAVNNTSCTPRAMQCTDSTHYQTCGTDSKWAPAQTCQSGLVCKKSGNYAYCVRPNEVAAGISDSGKLTINIALVALVSAFFFL